jgi:protein-disulfide isomerase
VVARGFVAGTPDAAFQVVVFGDYQCEPCAGVQHKLKLLLHEYPGLPGVRYRHFPIAALHPHAFDAARTAECAGTQGRFPQYHDQLFAGQKTIGPASWGSFAVAARVPDMGDFRSCIARRVTENDVELDAGLGRSLGLTATPTILINGRKFRSLRRALQVLEARLREFARRARS